MKEQGMESQEVIREALERASAKEVANHLGVSLSLVYKWCGLDPREGGATSNPLERARQLYESTGHEPLVQWLCHKAEGVFVKNPPTGRRSGREVMPAMQEIVQKFADLLAAISQSAADNRINESEAKAIRREWDELKSHTERFVKWCEAGDFQHLSEDLSSLS